MSHGVQKESGVETMTEAAEHTKSLETMTETTRKDPNDLRAESVLLFQGLDLSETPKDPRPGDH